MFRCGCGIENMIAFPFPFPINCKQHNNCLASSARSYSNHGIARIEKSLFALSPPAKFTFHILFFIFYLHWRKGNLSSSWSTLAFGEDVREFSFCLRSISSWRPQLKKISSILLRSIPTTKIKINFWFLTLLGGEHKNIMYVYVLAWPWFLFFS